MKKYLCVIYALGILLLATLCFCGCNEEAVVSDNAPIETEVQTSKEEIVINKPDSREKVLFVTREFEDGEHKYKISMYGMQSAEKENKFSDFRIELRDEKNFMLLNTPLDMGEYGDSLFTAERPDRGKGLQLVGMEKEDDKRLPLFAVQLLSDEGENSFFYRAFFKIKDNKLEYLTLKDGKAVNYTNLGNVLTFFDEYVDLYGDMATNEIYGAFLYEDLYNDIKTFPVDEPFKTIDFSENNIDYTANLIFTDVSYQRDFETRQITISCRAKIEIINNKTSEKFYSETTIEFDNGQFDLNLSCLEMKSNLGTEKTLIALEKGLYETCEIYALSKNGLTQCYFDGRISSCLVDGCYLVNNHGLRFILNEYDGDFSLDDCEQVISAEPIFADGIKFVDAMKNGKVSDLFPAEYSKYYDFFAECEFESISYNPYKNTTAITQDIFVAQIEYFCTKSANKDLIEENQKAYLYLYIYDSNACLYIKLSKNSKYEESSPSITVLENYIGGYYLQAYLYECLWGNLQSQDKDLVNADDKDIIEKVRIMNCFDVSSMDTVANTYDLRGNVNQMKEYIEFYGVLINPENSELYEPEDDSIGRDETFKMKRLFASANTSYVSDIDITAQPNPPGTPTMPTYNAANAVDYYADPLQLYKVKTIEYTINYNGFIRVVSTKVIEDNGGEVGFTMQ